MKTASIKEMRQELNEKSTKELIDICLRFSKFKKENKELLTYLLFDSNSEQAYIQLIKDIISEEFSVLIGYSYYQRVKGIRKILRITKKYIRYSQKKETQIELLIFFCHELNQSNVNIHEGAVSTIFEKQIESIKKEIQKLHEDLRFDFEMMLEEYDLVF